MSDELNANSSSVEGDFIEGDKVLGDKIVVGDVERSAVAIGEGAQVIYNNVERALSSVELARQAAEFERERLAEAVTSYVSRLQQRVEAVRKQPRMGTPYKSLLAYDFDDAAIFYGRTQAINVVLNRIQRAPLTVLHADSGTGKTSLLKAGVMPRLLADGAVPLYVRPYQTPVPFAIKRALLPQLEQAPNLGVAALHDFLRQVSHLLGGGQMVILLDQFEELFTQQSPEARGEFVSELAPCLDDTTLPVRWLLALRGEWFTQLGTFRPNVPDPFSNEYLLRALSAEEAREVIVQPAALYGVRYEEGLVARLVTDLGEKEIAPPQLQLVCSALYENLGGADLITTKQYESLGRTEGILRSHLERVLSRNVPNEQREAARLLLEALITSDGRRALRTGDDLAAELAVQKVPRGAFDAVLRLLVDSRLLRVDEVEIDDRREVVYELAHDYLLGEIELDPVTRARKAAQELLAREVTSYRQYGTLLSDDEMAIVKPYLDTLGLEGAARELVDASLAEQERQLLEEEANRRRELTRLRIFAVVLAGLGLMAAFFGLQATRSARDANVAATQVASERDRSQSAEATAESARQSAEQAEGRALQQAAISRSLALAAQAELELEGLSPERAVLLGLEALENYPYTPQAERALGSAVQRVRVRLLLTGHNDRLFDAAFSPDGSRVITAGRDGTARVWDAATGAALLTLSGHTTYLTSVVYSPDGTRIATASADNTARVWDAATGAELLVLAGHTASVEGIAFSADGTRIATAGRDNTVRVWDAATGAELLSLAAHNGGVTDVAFSPDGSQIASGGGDRAARIWDAATGEELQAFTGHADTVNSVAFNLDGTRLLTASGDGTALLWDTATGAQLRTIANHGEWVESARFSPDGTRVVTASNDGTARVWDAGGSVRELFSLRGHVDWVVSARFSPDGQRIVTAGRDFTARVWDARPDSALRTLAGHTGLVNTVAFSPDGTRLLSAGSDGTARVWDVASGQPLLVISGPETTIDAAAFSPDGTRIVTVTREGALRIWDAATGEALSAYADFPAWSVSFSPDGRFVIATSIGQDVSRIVQLATGLEVASFDQHSDWVRDAAFSPDGARIVTASWDNTARVWEVATGTNLATLVGHGSSLYSVAFSPDGTRIVTTSRDGTARVWDAATGRQLLNLAGHTGIVFSVEFSPDGARVITASRDGTVKIWDALTGQELLTLLVAGGWPRDAAFSPNNGLVATALSNGTIKLWQVWPQISDLVTYAESCCKVRELTDAERAQFESLLGR